MQDCEKYGHQWIKWKITEQGERSIEKNFFKFIAQERQCEECGAVEIKYQSIKI